ncbi:LysR substrate-binding domain-containing protein, partial [Staphylococcus sp. 231237_7MaSpsaltlick]|uniref:LysR substrate-binding domain-containing protein n=1 Tax=Staphylococcus sp. 231237_7MaSpsaltlick TaxID=3367518 RepID=UPI00370BBDBE
RINDIAFQEIQDELNKQNHRLVIGASFTIGEYLLPQVISEFKKKNTNIQIELSIGNTPSILEKLNLNEVDVALVEGVFQIEKYDVHKFAEDNMIAICSSQNKLLKKDSVELSDLLNEKYIVRDKVSGM